MRWEFHFFVTKVSYSTRRVMNDYPSSQGHCHLRQDFFELLHHEMWEINLFRDALGVVPNDSLASWQRVLTKNVHQFTWRILLFGLQYLPCFPNAFTDVRLMAQPLRAFNVLPRILQSAPKNTSPRGQKNPIQWNSNWFRIGFSLDLVNLSRFWGFGKLEQLFECWELTWDWYFQDYCWASPWDVFWGVVQDDVDELLLVFDRFWKQWSRE